jgi:hypothetical protein
MKKIVLAALLSSGLLMAADTTEDFFYQNGYEQGQKDGFNQGVAAAFKEAKKVLEAYKEEIRAYEIGKYLVKERYLTAPKIYQVIDENGGLKVDISKSRIEKELSIDDIFAKFGTIPVMNETNNISNDTLSLDEQNSVNIASRDNIINLPGEADKNNKIITVSIEKNSKNEEILKKSNTVYSLDDDRFKVMFFSRTEQTNFCNSFKICR